MQISEHKKEKNAKILVINLERSQDRLSNCKKLLSASNLEFERVEAIDGSSLSISNIAPIYQFEARDSYYKSLNKGEIGCYLSHRKAWQIIVEKSLDFAIILEDDFCECRELEPVIKLLNNICGDWDYIKLAKHRRERKFIAQKSLGSFTLGVFEKLPAGTMAQAVSLNGAKKLLKQSERIKRPVDMDIQHAFESELLAFGLEEPPIKIEFDSKSEIELQGQRKKAKTDRIKQMKQAFQFIRQNKIYTEKLVDALNKIEIDISKV